MAWHWICVKPLFGLLMTNSFKVTPCYNGSKIHSGNRSISLVIIVPAHSLTSVAGSDVWRYSSDHVWIMYIQYVAPIHEGFETCYVWIDSEMLIQHCFCRSPQSNTEGATSGCDLSVCSTTKVGYPSNWPFSVMLSTMPQRSTTWYASPMCIPTQGKEKDGGPDVSLKNSPSSLGMLRASTLEVTYYLIIFNP